jgi:hypothetical protein
MCYFECWPPIVPRHKSWRDGNRSLPPLALFWCRSDEPTSQNSLDSDAQFATKSILIPDSVHLICNCNEHHARTNWPFVANWRPHKKRISLTLDFFGGGPRSICTERITGPDDDNDDDDDTRGRASTARARPLKRSILVFFQRPFLTVYMRVWGKWDFVRRMPYLSRVAARVALYLFAGSSAKLVMCLADT